VFTKWKKKITDTPIIGVIYLYSIHVNEYNNIIHRFYRRVERRSYIRSRVERGQIVYFRTAERRRRRRWLRSPCLACFISIAVLLYLYHSFTLPITSSLSLSLSLCLSLSPPSISAIIWVSRFSDYEISHECPFYVRVKYAQYTRPEICAICYNIKKI